MTRRSRIADAGPSPGVAAIVLADGELAAGERAVLIVSAASRVGVVPEARRPRQRFAGRPARPVVGDDLEDQVATLTLEPLPGLFAELLEDAVERRMRDDQATGAAAVARLDDRQAGARSCVMIPRTL